MAHPNPPPNAAVAQSPEELANNFHRLLRRYGGATAQGFIAVLCPLLVPIHTLDKTVVKLAGQGHYRASFTALVTPENRSVMVRGRTGKFVPSTYNAGGLWREISKGRIIEIDTATGVASGEVYTGGRRADLEEALELMDGTELLEIDQFGAAAKVLSGLAEYGLAQVAEANGYEIRRMPEDMAKHLGSYMNVDFELAKNGVTKKVEVKSLWGTNTRYARLIHSTTTKPTGEPETWTLDQTRNYYPTSSCKFETQDILAVSLFLRTGNINDFAFARSVPRTQHAHGLPHCVGYPNHVNQNPLCEIGDGSWFATIDEVWNLP
jgi:hypothetical protein